MDQVWKGLSNLDPRDPGGFYKKTALKRLLSLVVDGGSNGQGHKTRQGKKARYREIPLIYRRRGKVNQLDVGKKKTNKTMVVKKNK